MHEIAEGTFEFWTFFKALKKSQNSEVPTAISCKTIIGYGSPNKSGKASVHGSPLGEEEITLVRKKLKWNYKPFEIPKNIMDEWKKIGEKASADAEKNDAKYQKKIKKLIWLGTSSIKHFKNINLSIEKAMKDYLKNMSPTK